jgi:hypothetical protein
LKLLGLQQANQHAILISAEQNTRALQWAIMVGLATAFSLSSGFDQVF